MESNSNTIEVPYENHTLDVPSDAFEGETLVFVAGGYEPILIHEAFAELHGATIQNEITPETDLLITDDAVDEDLLEEVKEFGVDVWHYIRFEHYIVQMYSSLSRMKEIPDEDDAVGQRDCAGSEENQCDLCGSQIEGEVPLSVHREAYPSKPHASESDGCDRPTQVCDRCIRKLAPNMNMLRFVLGLDTSDFHEDAEHLARMMVKFHDLINIGPLTTDWEETFPGS